MSFDKVAFLEIIASQTKEEMIEVVLDMAQRTTKDAQFKVEELQRQLEEPAQKRRKKIDICLRC